MAFTEEYGLFPLACDKGFHRGIRQDTRAFLPETEESGLKEGQFSRFRQLRPSQGTSKKACFRAFPLRVGAGEPAFLRIYAREPCSHYFPGFTTRSPDFGQLFPENDSDIWQPMRIHMVTPDSQAMRSGTTPREVISGEKALI